MFDQNGAESIRPVESFGDRVHPAQPQHGALPGGVTGGNGWRGLVLAGVVVLVLVGVGVYVVLA
jgi:hypothetical protein